MQAVEGWSHIEFFLPIARKLRTKIKTKWRHKNDANCIIISSSGKKKLFLSGPHSLSLQLFTNLSSKTYRSHISFWLRFMIIINKPYWKWNKNPVILYNEITSFIFFFFTLCVLLSVITPYLMVVCLIYAFLPSFHSLKLKQ